MYLFLCRLLLLAYGDYFISNTSLWYDVCLSLSLSLYVPASSQLIKSGIHSIHKVCS